jgi:hypothetical protein
MLMQTLLLTPYLAVAASIALTAIVTIICVREPMHDTSGFDLTKGRAVRRGELARFSKERRCHASSRPVARPAA